MLFWLKKDVIEISLWLKMFLQREKWREESLMFIYMITLGESLTLEEVLKKVSQLGWFSTSTNVSPSSLIKLGIEQIVDYESFWIKMISKEIWVLRIMLVSRLFFQMFWEKRKLWNYAIEIKEEELYNYACLLLISK